ncbi:hypothetical protein J7384_04240 [Endozoicomonas sp. G2_1]|uniref:hypothetical protein n=1 Tax=Endozoicomonas sp. G2_1 TaxID=2821091 RepID=UPI001ADAD128|nr:hypothetical protein [Endozoicomonas sp. G2_1]MBO9489566.1 hypothetical protein [Endozoicomonas sp. G2_1]
MNIHGEFEVSLDGNIICCKLSGSFNEQGSLAYQKQTKDLILSFDKQPFGMFIDIVDIEGATPDAYSSLDIDHIWQLSRPLIAKAYLVKSLVYRDIFMRQSTVLEQQNSQFFTNKAEAIAWLKQQLVIAGAD